MHLSQSWSSVITMFQLWHESDHSHRRVNDAGLAELDILSQRKAIFFQDDLEHVALWMLHVGLGTFRTTHGQLTVIADIVDQSLWAQRSKANQTDGFTLRCHHGRIILHNNLQLFDVSKMHIGKLEKNDRYSCFTLTWLPPSVGLWHHHNALEMDDTLCLAHFVPPALLEFCKKSLNEKCNWKNAELVFINSPIAVLSSRSVDHLASLAAEEDFFVALLALTQWLFENT